MAHLLQRQIKLNLSQSAGSLLELKSSANVSPIRILDDLASTSASPNKLEQLERQRAIRDLKMHQAKQARHLTYEEKQKRRILFVVKQDLVASYKHEQFSKKFDELRQKALVREWVRKISLRATLATIFERYTYMRQKMEDAHRRI